MINNAHSDSTLSTPSMTLLFEPWSLGDALIAAWAIHWVKRTKQVNLGLACASHYHELISQIYPGIPLVAVDLPYTGTQKARLLKQIQSLPRSSMQVAQVVSIRGDIRDYLASRRIFPNSKRYFRGWRMFMARRSTFLDLPYKTGIFSIQNRYWQWVRVLGGEQGAMTHHYPSAQTALKIAIHTGAQWQRKRYPYVKELKEILEGQGHTVQAYCGPSDPVYQGLNSEYVASLSGTQAIKELSKYDLIITNDSGPMHLAAAMGKPTVGIFANTGAVEWTPPTALAVGATDLPGYRLKFFQATHEPLPDPAFWIAPDQIVKELQKLGWIN